MSRLFFSDRGRSLRWHHEEVTRWRTVRKTFTLPAQAVGSPADLWMYIWRYGNKKAAPVEVVVNGRCVDRIRCDEPHPRFWMWHQVRVPRVTSRKVEVILRTDTPAMNALSLGLDPSVAPRNSAISGDQGKTWQSRSMGAHQVLRGEYLIRLRSHAPNLTEQPLPRIVYDDPKHPRLKALHDALPAAIKRIRSPWKQVLALRTWIATRWVHDPFGIAYAPWDPATILDWGNRDWCHGQKGHVTMCVHFGAAFVGFAAALGHKARNVIITRHINSPNGHFVSEVFDPDLASWVVHDPNYDMHFADGKPLSAVQMSDLALADADTTAFAQEGPGLPTAPQRVVDGYRNWFINGKSYRHMGIWVRNDFTSDPTVQSPNHGATSYTETDVVWYSPRPHDISPMLPYRTPSAKVFEGVNERA